MNTYLCWETDAQCNPTGIERKLKASSGRNALAHIAYEEGVQCNRRTVVHCKDGRLWFCSLPLTKE